MDVLDEASFRMLSAVDEVQGHEAEVVACLADEFGRAVTQPDQVGEYAKGGECPGHE